MIWALAHAFFASSKASAAPRTSSKPRCCSCPSAPRASATSRWLWRVHRWEERGFGLVGFGFERVGLVWKISKNGWFGWFGLWMLRRFWKNGFGLLWGGWKGLVLVFFLDKVAMFGELGKMCGCFDRPYKSGHIGGSFLGRANPRLFGVHFTPSRLNCQTFFWLVFPLKRTKTRKFKLFY